MPDFLFDHFSEFLGGYMFLALALILFTGLPVAIAVGGVALMFGFLGIYFELTSINDFFIIVPRFWGGDGSSGAVQNPVLVAIPAFIFMGTMLERSRVADYLLEILNILLRRVPGGLALAVTLMGTIMAATTGIIGASVVMMTLLALPTMLRQGYHPPLATGTIAASATLGILIPPSIMLVLMANLLAVSLGNLFVGALFPGLVLAGLYMVYIFIVSMIKPQWAPPLPPDAFQLEKTQLKSVITYFAVFAAIIVVCILLGHEDDAKNLGGKSIHWGLVGFFSIFAFSMIYGRREGDSLFGKVLVGFVPPVFLIAMVLGSILMGFASPTEAAGVGAFGAIILAIFNSTLTWNVMKEVCHRTALTSGMIFFIFIGATTFSYFFRALYGEDLIIEFIEWLHLGPWGLLFLLMFVIFLLGFFFDFLEITLIILPVFAPIVAELDFGDHVQGRDILYWFAILAAVNMQTSFLTPPFGFALFYMKGVAGKTVKMQDIYIGIIPFVILQLIGLGFTIAFPALSLWLPSMLLD